MERLSKTLARAGVASRRECENIIRAGRVRVNGSVITIPQEHVDLKRHVVEVDGQRVAKKEQKYYFALNKPRGYLCANEEGKRTVFRLFTNVDARLFTVGRLDRDTTGLLIVTNDGHFSNDVIHPSNGITKEYLVKTNREITDHHLKTISEGCEVEGKWVRPLKIAKVRRGTLKIVVGEGRKHEVRKLVDAAGLEVRELKRVRIGSLHLGNLPEGCYRDLSAKERLSVIGSID